jgi:hypothetical protein
VSWFRRARRPEAEPGPATQKPAAATADEAPTVIGPPAIPSRARVLAHEAQAMDYLATPAVAAYFDAREYEAYHQALKRVGARRDFHERLVPVLERFIDLTEPPKGAAAVDRVMAESLHAEQQARAVGDGAPLEVARARHPEGTKLLGLTEPLTFDALKTAYRGAARRHHPDVGGSHSNMLLVNEVFEFVHALLREREVARALGEIEGSLATGVVEVRNCLDYRYSCGELLFLAALDDWNVDTAFLWLERITSAPWQQSPYAQDSWRRVVLIEPAGKLASRLSLVGFQEQAARALAVARDGLLEAQNRQLSYEHFVRDPEDALAGSRRAHVVINHQRQADNALRLGVIDAKRYQKIMERLASAAAADDMYEERLRQIQAGGGFLRDLPTDRVARGKVSQRRLVPEPGYYVNRIAQLMDDQQAEYLVAFSDRGTLPLVRKYTFVRLMSLVESVLFYPGQVDDAAAEREARGLASLHDGSGSFYGTEVSEMLAELGRQPAAERQARASVLKAIDRGGGRNIHAAGITLTFGGVSPLGMPLGADYFKTIRRPIDDLRTMERTGRLPEREEDRRDREAWGRDLEVLRTPEVGAAQEAAFAAMHLAKSDPEAALQQFTGYCNLLLDLGPSMVHVQELQLGFWVDRLTATLVRLKRWREALEWLERYFALPARYRGRSNPSEEAGLQKRLDRCAEMLREQTGTR